MAQSLQGKVAIITGGARGIGRATAIALAKEGVTVGLIARSESGLKEVATQIEGLGVKVAYAMADVSSQEQVEVAVTLLAKELGNADILINNAGIATFGSVLDMEPEEWKKIVDVNL
ncbi:TPA: SDR family NAD(P)-dependent oxidoreductase, partial [Salmonella enterica subsp. enterica serovar Typhi str. AG3]|nr:SDR family NAD(P)-dependent oxidoreductase [Salmonella enterica subsp. enterica serovar Typhi str. AG3]